jgi:hypothetical protein
MARVNSLLWIVVLGLSVFGAACNKDVASVGGNGGSAGWPGLGEGTGGKPGWAVDLDAAAGSGFKDAGTEDLSVCKTEQASASVLPTRLVFVFDVSGSMGEGDYAWHDKTLKWDPVVAATKGFFTDPSSQGISASMVFFPTDSDATKCVASTYATPNVPMTALPAAVFGTAIDAEYPDGNGTPTVAVIQGALTYLRAQQAAVPGKYSLVMATDGYPTSCGDDNTIANAANIVHAALAEGISTYVIGVKNPPITGAPDVVSNLSQIATAGGTTLFLLDTGSPGATQQAFSKAIGQIRDASIACDILIPAPPAGRTFDKEKVIMTYASGTNAPMVLTYDADCVGSNSWRYDNRSAPTRVVLCPTTCAMVQADAKAILNVGFACEQVITVIP